MGGKERSQSLRHTCSGRAERVYDPNPVVVEPRIPLSESRNEALRKMFGDIAGFAEKIATQLGFPKGYEKVVVQELIS